MSIAHREGEKIVLDRVVEVRPPFSPDSVVEELSILMKGFATHNCVSDRWGGEFVTQAFAKQGIRVDQSDLSASEIYAEAQPLLASGRVELLDDERLAGQLMALERRTRTGGRDLITHPDGLHDDMANAACGAIVIAARGTIWTESEMNAHLPQTQHGSPAGIRREAQESLEAEMRDWMAEGFGGMSRIVRR